MFLYVLGQSQDGEEQHWTHTITQRYKSSAISMYHALSLNGERFIHTDGTGFIFIVRGLEEQRSYVHPVYTIKSHGQTYIQ